MTPKKGLHHILTAETAHVRSLPRTAQSLPLELSVTIAQSHTLKQQLEQAAIREEHLKQRLAMLDRQARSLVAQLKELLPAGNPKRKHRQQSQTENNPTKQKLNEVVVEY